MGRMTAAIWLAGTLLVTAVANSALAQDTAPIPVTLKDHRFTPAEIHVKANEAAQIY